MVFRAGLDRCGKSRLHRDSIPGPFSPQVVAIPTTLPVPYVTEGWVENFKKRETLDGGKRIGDSASADHWVVLITPNLSRRQSRRITYPKFIHETGASWHPTPMCLRTCRKWQGNVTNRFASRSLLSPLRPALRFITVTNFSQKHRHFYQKSKQSPLILLFLSCFAWFP